LFALPALSTSLPMIVFVGVCAFAIWKGDEDERLAGAALAIADIATPFLKDHRWLGPQWGVFAVDMAFFALIVVIAFRTTKYWPIAAAGFQLLGLLTHAAMLIDKGVRAWAYVTAGVIWSYLILIALGVGTWNVWQARRHPAISGAPAAAGETRR
jgi:hypothetical protein